MSENKKGKKSFKKITKIDEKMLVSTGHQHHD